MGFLPLLPLTRTYNLHNIWGLSDRDQRLISFDRSFVVVLSPPKYPVRIESQGRHTPIDLRWIEVKVLVFSYKVFFAKF